MSCFFCDSIYHVSHNCNNYVSDESRRRRATLKKCCSKCLNLMHFNARCLNCESQQKCYICFSSTHHTVYCPNRNYASKITPKIDNDLMCRFRKISNVSVCPKIDDDLFSRYVKLLTKVEKYILAINNPAIFDAAKLKPIKVTSKKRLSFTNIYQMFQGSDFISIDEGICEKSNLNEITVPSSPSLPIIYISNLEIIGSKFPSADLLQLLSAKTKILKCKFTQFLPKLTFREILEKAPKLEGINIYQSNIEVNNKWPEELLQFSRCNNLQYLYLQIPNIDFNIKSLVKMITQKSSHYFYINLYLDLQWNEHLEIKRSIANKLSHCFVAEKESWQRCLRIYFSSNNPQNLCITEFEDYIFKNV